MNYPCLLLLVSLFLSADLLVAATMLVDRNGNLLQHSQLQCWLSSSTLVASSSQAGVSAWQDSSSYSSSPNACNFVAINPLLVSSHIDSNQPIPPYLSFVGSVSGSSSLQNQNSLFSTMFSNSYSVASFTVFLVAKFSSVQAAMSAPFPVLYTIYGSVTGSKLTLEASQAPSDPSAINFRVSWKDASGAGSTTAAVTSKKFDRGRFHVLALVQTMDATLLYVDGTTGASGPGSTEKPDASIINSWTLNLGNPSDISTWIGRGSNAATDTFDGSLGEALFYSTSLSSHDVDRVGNYLASKFLLEWNPCAGSTAAAPVTIFPFHGPVGASGARISITGDFVIPTDAAINPTLALEPLLRVSIAQRIPACFSGAAASQTMCLPPPQTGWIRKDCTDIAVQRASGTSGTISCNLPRANRPPVTTFLLVEWQGLSYYTTYLFDQIAVVAVVPTRTSYQGGSLITIHGENFVPMDAWAAIDNPSVAALAQVTVEISSVPGVRVDCKNTTFVSSRELVCTAPPIALAYHPTVQSDPSKRTVNAAISIRTGLSRVEQTQVTLQIDGIPALFGCPQTTAAGVSSCQSCCLRACTSDSVFLPVGSGDAGTASCLSTCSSYCGASTFVNLNCNQPAATSSILWASGLDSRCSPNFSQLSASLSPIALLSSLPAASKKRADLFQPIVVTPNAVVTITIIGNMLEPGDMVKIITSSGAMCESGSSDTDSVVPGGTGKKFDQIVSQGTMGYVSFALQPGTIGIVCYKPVLTSASIPFSYVRVSQATISTQSIDGTPHLAVSGTCFPSTIAATGAALVTVSGTDFSNVQSISARLGSTQCENTLWLSSQSLRCKVASIRSGEKNLVPPVVSQSQQMVATGIGALAFTPVFASAVLRSNAPATSGFSLTILGQALGVKVGAPGVVGPSVRIGDTACFPSSSIWKSESCILCKVVGVAPSTRRNAAAISVGSGGRPVQTLLLPLLTYDLQITGSMVTNVAASGAMSVTIFGVGFSIQGYSIANRAGCTSSKASTWISDSSLTGLSPSGTTALLPAVTTVQRAATMASIAMRLTYDLGSAAVIVVSSPIAPNFPITASCSLTVTGSVFGFTNGAVMTRVLSVGGTRTQGPVAWVSHTAIAGKVSAGVTSKRVGVAVLQDGSIGTVSWAVTYNVFPNAGSSAVASNHPATGAMSITVLGQTVSSFVAADASKKLRFGVSSSEAWLWTASTSISGKIPKGSTTTGASAAATILTGRDPLDGNSYRQSQMTLTSAFTLSVPAFIRNPIRGNSPSTGGASLILVLAASSNFQRQSPMIRLSPTGAASTSSWNSISSMACKPPRRALTSKLSGVDLQVTITSSVVTSTRSISYDGIESPMLASAIAINFAATGAVSITVIAATGSGNGNSCTSKMRLHYIGTGGEVSQNWISDSQLFCKVSSGLGSKNGFGVILTGSHAGTVTKALTYGLSSPNAAAFQLYGTTANTAATGSTSVTVLAPGASAVSRYSAASFALNIGSSAAQCTTHWLSSSSLCTKSFGIFAANGGWNLVVVALSVAGSVSTNTRAVSFNTGSLSTVVRSNHALTGDTSVTLLGRGFYGAAGCSSSKIRVAASNAKGTTWVSSSSVVAKPASGGSKNFGICATAMNADSSNPNVAFNLRAQLASTLTMTLTHDKGFISSVFRVNFPLTGDASLTILSISLGPNGQGRFGRTATEATSWLSDSTTAIRSAFTTGEERKSLSVEASVGGSVSTLTMSISYDAVVTFRYCQTVCSTASCAMQCTPRNGMNPSGAISVTITGSNLGSGPRIYSSVKPSLSISIGGTTCEAKPWASDSYVLCKIPSGMTMRGMGIAVTVANGVLSSQTSALSTDVSSITSLFAISSVSPTNGVPTGSISVTVLGSISVPRQSARGRISFTSGMSTYFISGSSIRCKASQIPIVTMQQQLGAGILLAITLGATVTASTMSRAVSFFVPSDASSFIRFNQPGTASLSVTILGRSVSYFYPVYSTTRIAVGSTGSGATVWASSTSSFAKVGSILLRGRSSEKIMVVSANSRALSTLSNVVTLDAALGLSTLVKVNGPSSGSISLTLTGVQLARWSPAIRLGQSVGEGSNWYSITSLLVKTTLCAPLAVTGRSLVATLGTAPLTLSLAASFDVVIGASSMLKLNAASTGAISVSVLGSLISGRRELVAASSSTIRMGSTVVDSTKWISCSALVGKTHRAVQLDAHLLKIRCSVSQLVGSASNFFSLDGAVGSGASSVVRDNFAFTGAISITVVSSGVGLMMSQKIRCIFGGGGGSSRGGGGTYPSSTSWQSQTTIVSKQSRGSSTNNGWIVAVSMEASRGRVATGVAVLSYDQLSMGASLVRSNLVSTSSCSVTVLASNVGCTVGGAERYHSGRLLLGMSAAGATTWFGGTSVQLKGNRMMYNAMTCPYSGLAVAVTASETNAAVRPLLSTCSASRAVSYDGSSPSLSVRSNSAQTASVYVTILGKSCGSLTSLSAKGRIGGTALQVTTAASWVSTTALPGKLAASFGGKLVSDMVCSISPRTLTVAMSFDVGAVVGFITAIGSCNVATTGSKSVTLYGSIQSFSSSPCNRIGGTTMELSNWGSLTTLRSKSVGAGGSKVGALAVALTAGGVKAISTLTSSFTMNEPTRTAVSRYVQPSTGGVSVTVLGSDFGRTGSALAYTAKTRHGGTGSESTRWLSGTTISGRVASESSVSFSRAGISPTIPLSLSYPRATLSQINTFDPPLVSSAKACNAASTASVSVTILGSNYGERSLSSSLRAKSTSGMSTTWNSDSSLRSKVSTAWTTDTSVAIKVASLGTTLVVTAAQKQASQWRLADVNTAFSYDQGLK